MSNKNKFPLTENALSYTWCELAKRAGVLGDVSLEKGFADLGITLHYADPAEVKSDAPCIIVIPCEDDNPKKILSAKDNILDWIPAQDVFPKNIELPFTDNIPILFWGKGHNGKEKPFAEIKGKRLIFYADIISASFFMLSRWEEIVNVERDDHRRFPAQASVAYKQNFIDRPIVDEYALILRTWLEKFSPEFKPKKRKFSVKLSHDIDHIRYFRNWKIAILALLDAIRNDFSFSKILEIFLGVFVPQKDPYVKGIYTLASLAQNYGYEDVAFFFMVDQYGEFGSYYDIDSNVAGQIIENLQKQGFDVGIHPGYYTYNNLAKLKEEKLRMDAVLGKKRYGGRQHYLRFQVPSTWGYWEEIGLTYDSSLGYADYEGFRGGTCHPFMLFDIDKDIELNVEEFPLIVMDGVLKDYRKLTLEQALENVIKLAQRCKNVEGTFTLLWHNTSLLDSWAPWLKIYEEVLITLACE